VPADLNSATALLKWDVKIHVLAFFVFRTTAEVAPWTGPPVFVRHRALQSIAHFLLQITQQPAEADFILAHGTEALADSSGDANPKTIVQLEDLLRQCAAAGMPPMVVANPGTPASPETQTCITTQSVDPPVKRICMAA